MQSLAPIVLFVYNRPEHTRQTLEALSKNDLAKDSVLYIYSDGAKENTDENCIRKIEETRKVLKQQQWCKEVHIIESDKNKGLADSIITGVSEIINKHGKAIVLEDDIVTSTFFLKYMNTALELYRDESKVMHISGYVPTTTGADKLPDTYFLRFMNCWGWATWKRAWEQLITDIPYLYKTLPQQPDFNDFNLNGTLNQFSQIEQNYNGSLKTWGIKWYATIFLKKGLCLYPKYSLVKNIGFDNSGQNTYATDGSFDVRLTNYINVTPIKIQENKYAKKYLIRFYSFGPDSSLNKRIKRIIKNTFLYKLYSGIRYR